ncbi:ATP-binding protein [Sunxiuqinia indica]|uniref:ATP-binding protein n=1 Tax=Sunxiuqinia indica TaxID=2692584 RepID=UPI00135C7916|nr:ATP-binding protein [Sunxiuqinia indica]
MNPNHCSLKNGISPTHSENIKGLYKTGLILILCFGFIATFAEETFLYQVGLPNVPGFMSRDQNGEVKGFPLVLFEKIAQDENIQFEWVDGSWNELFIKVQNGEIDVLPGTQETAKRKEILDFTDSNLYTMWSELYMNKQTDFKNILQLENKKIGLVIDDNNAAGFLKYIAEFDIKIQAVYINSHSEALNRLKRKELFAIVGPSPNLLGELPPEVVSSGLYFNPTELKYSFPIGKNEDLRKKIDNRLAIYKSTPNSIYFQLIADYKKAVFEQAQWVLPIWLQFLIYGFITLFGVAFLFIAVLRQQVKTRTRELKDRDTYLHKAMEVGEMGTWEMSLEDRKIYWSDEVYSFTGVNKEKEYLTAEYIKSLIHPDDLEDVINFFRKIDQKETVEKECRIINKLNQTIYVRLFGQLLRNEQQIPVKSIGIIQMITDQKLREQELIKAKETAEKNEKLKSAFLANMSHEIRTPLNSIIGFSYLIASNEVEEDRKQDFINIIIKQNENLLTIINDVIDISKIETNSLEIAKKRTEVKPLLKRIYVQHKEDCPALIDFKLDIQLDYYDCIINTDQTRLEQILNNFISNAFKYTPEGVVTLGCRESSIPGNFDLFVKDTGIGISQKDRALLFSRFTQVDNLKQGAGLGLAISHSLAQLLGSKIHVISKKGKGSEFYLSFPLFEA